MMDSKIHPLCSASQAALFSYLLEIIENQFMLPGVITYFY